MTVNNKITLLLYGYSRFDENRNKFILQSSIKYIITTISPNTSYMLRCQKKQVDGKLRVLRAKYPNMVVLEPRCDDGNAIHVWNRFKQRVLTKENYYRNHFRLPPDAEELFEDMFGILV